MLVSRKQHLRPPKFRATRLAHYYNWWGAWGHSISQSLYTPSQYTLLGSYDSANLTMVANHIEQAIYSGLDGFIQDWWGIGQEGDIAGPGGSQIAVFTEYLDLTQADYPDFKWSIHYEDEGFSNPTVATIRTDLQYLKANYFDHPQYLLSKDGRPVVFVYESGGQDQDMANRWREAVDKETTSGNPIYYLIPNITNFRTAPNQPDGWHSYAISGGSDIFFPWMAALEPGVEIWTEGAGPYTLARDFDRFERDLKIAGQTELDFIIFKFNEHHEGTHTESTEEEGEIYPNIMRNILGVV